MSCFFCKGTMEESTTIHTVELKNCIVVIKNVPCQKCDQCDEVVINADVAARYVFEFNFFQVLHRYQRTFALVG